MSNAVAVNDETEAPTVTAELMEEGQVPAVPMASFPNAPEATATAFVEDSSTLSNNPEDVPIVSANAEPIAMDIDLESSDAITGGRAEFISVTFVKKTADVRLGIAISEQRDGTNLISKLRSDGPLSFSPLRVGDKVLSINNKSCVDFDRGAATELLRQLVGTITIVVQNIGGDPKLVETMVEKAVVDSVVGIGVRRNARGSLEVVKVSAQGLFAHSLVNVGDRMIAINSIGCGSLDPITALDIIRSAPRYVTLLTETQHQTAFVLAAASDNIGALELEHAAATAITIDEDMGRYREQTCFCTWMIILSLLFTSIAIYRRL